MKNDENWSGGTFERAAMNTATNETDCSSWDAHDSVHPWSEGKFESAAIPAINPVAIGDDSALAVARKHIADLLDQLEHLRKNCRPEEFVKVSTRYRSQVESIQREILDYLTRPTPRTL
jgi:hypothetical protein